MSWLVGRLVGWPCVLVHFTDQHVLLRGFVLLAHNLAAGSRICFSREHWTLCGPGLHCFLARLNGGLSSFSAFHRCAEKRERGGSVCVRERRNTHTYTHTHTHTHTHTQPHRLLLCTAACAVDAASRPTAWSVAFLCHAHVWWPRPFCGVISLAQDSVRVVGWLPAC